MSENKQGWKKMKYVHKVHKYTLTEETMEKKERKSIGYYIYLCTLHANFSVVIMYAKHVGMFFQVP